jgi:hypothetical protein
VSPIAFNKNCEIEAMVQTHHHQRMIIGFCGSSDSFDGFCCCINYLLAEQERLHNLICDCSFQHVGSPGF